MQMEDDNTPLEFVLTLIQLLHFGASTNGINDDEFMFLKIDLFNRKIIGWSMGDRLITQSVEDVLTMAVNREKPPKGVLHHSDRGSQYCSEKYQHLLNKP